MDEIFETGNPLWSCIICCRSTIHAGWCSPHLWICLKNVAWWEIEESLDACCLQCSQQKCKFQGLHWLFLAELQPDLCFFFGEPLQCPQQQTALHQWLMDILSVEEGKDKENNTSVPDTEIWVIRCFDDIAQHFSSRRNQFNASSAIFDGHFDCHMLASLFPIRNEFFRFCDDLSAVLHEILSDFKHNKIFEPVLNRQVECTSQKQGIHQELET